ncbi:mannose-6-phosphate isomerase, class I [Nocardioides sp. SOB77]|uniref:mannose-6-phosphate isomerase n=1 Tax=Nocardioides oceani TaxID=3058369 RepID=A0ABT8FJ92_9ACTN|nr:mannose-6-phosphate isomerase, class I [Nocardioides oceani]MDN4174525.1 mannose-6-phosphate isomerase, class I [Nocardioides oceani]
MFVLRNAIREYAWGSSTHLPRFLGTEPTGDPQAELWIGAHDGDPSYLPDGRALNDVIAGDPSELLGRTVVDTFGPRLPYLMKVLAVAEPLSLQVHPSSSRARIGFAREDAAGVPLDAPHRSYKDTSHKPELIFALTRFEGMAGFRDTEKSAQILRLLDLPWADDVAHRLVSGPPFQTLRAIVTDMLARSGPDLEALLADVQRAARHAEERGHREEMRANPVRVDPARINREATRVFAMIGKLIDQYPADPGVLVTLLLNHVVLAPGEAMFLDAGVIHAYVSGLGVEIMASSDNVLRAGLTPKHMDVPELLSVTNFTPMPGPQWLPSVNAPHHCHLEPPVPDFALTVGDVPGVTAPAAGPRTVVVLDGEVDLVTDGEALTATRGQTVFVADADGPVRVTGHGRVAIGGVQL